MGTHVLTAGNASPTPSRKVAAASADDGDVAAVVEVDDVVMRTGDDETSFGWCFDLTSMCAVVRSTGSLLLDSGSDEHLCTPKFADLIPTSRDRSPLKLKDVQQNDLVISGQKTVPMLVGPTGGKHAMEATATACIETRIRGGGKQLSRMSVMSAWMVWTSKNLIHRRVLAQRWKPQLWNQQLKEERHLHLY